MRSLRGSYRLIRCRLWLAAAFTGLLLCGCSGGAKQPKTVPVTGQVLFEGAPLPRAEVVFVPVGATEDTPRPNAITDAEGRFTPTTFSARDGAPEGDYVVLVAYRPIVGKGDEATTGPNVLPPRFADPQHSPLRIHVSKSSSELEPLRVTRK